jgi:hypothetical protein
MDLFMKLLLIDLKYHLKKCEVNLDLGISYRCQFTLFLDH